MQITRSQANALFQALDFGGCKKWPVERMVKRLGELEDLKPENGLKDPDMQKLLEEALEAGDDLALVDVSEEDANDTETEDNGDGAEDTPEDNGGGAMGTPEGTGDGAEDTPEPTGRRAKKRAAAEARKKEGDDKTVKPKAKKPKAKPNNPDKAKAKAKAKPPKDKKLTQLDAAEKVLDNNDGKPLSTQELVMKMAEQGLWESPEGKTPAATLYVRMHKEEQAKGKQSRFKKVGPNMFNLLKNC